MEKNKELTVNEKEIVLDRVSRALDAQFELYSWEDMLGDCNLTPKELVWAKKHICYKAYIID